MLWTIPVVQKGAQLDVRQPATRGRVGLVDDESPPVLWFPAKIPGIPTRASIKLPSLGHPAVLRARAAAPGSIAPVAIFARETQKLLLAARVPQTNWAVG